MTITEALQKYLADTYFIYVYGRIATISKLHSQLSKGEKLFIIVRQYEA